MAAQSQRSQEQQGAAAGPVAEPAPLLVEMLPARHGDSILVTWGPSQDRHRLLVDGGPAGAYPAVSARLAEVAAEGPLDLLVLTHIDADHIEGTLLLTNDAELDLRIGEYWFNGPAQVFSDLGTAQGEMLAALISARGIPLNAAFEKAPVQAPDEGPLLTRCLPGGLTLTVIGPDAGSLRRLRDVWFTTCQNEGLVFASEAEALAALKARAGLNPATTFLAGEPTPDVPRLLQDQFSPDTTAPNRSSIVLLAEYAGHAVLLPGDATPATLEAGLRRLLAERHVDRLELSALKLPHHGSKRNITPALLDLVPAEHYLFSSDGGKFGHPDDAGVARCLAYGRSGSTLVFNYRNPRTLRWEEVAARGPRGNRTVYPAPGCQGIELVLPPRVPQEIR